MIHSSSQRWRILLGDLLLVVLMLQAAGAAFAQGVTGEYVTTADVQLRKGPGTNHEVVTTLPKGIKVNIVGREGTWLKVESKRGGKPGYINEQYARRAEPEQTGQPKTVARAIAGEYRVVTETDLRERPGINEKVVARLPAGIKINVIRAEGDWLRVESKRGGRPGYVEKRFVERWTDR